MNEEEVIRAVIDGDVERFREIYDAYHLYVKNFCYMTYNRLSGKEQQMIDLRDVVQTVFVELYKALPRFRFEAKFSTFITQIAINTMFNARKSHKRMVFVDDQNKMSNTSSFQNVETKIIQSETERHLYEAIGQLQYEQRTALVLFSFEDFSYKEIAEVMGCSLTKVETLIFRAKKKLRKLLETKV